jgi:hypothetical protein
MVLSQFAYGHDGAQDTTSMLEQLLAASTYDPDPTGELARPQQAIETFRGLMCVIAAVCLGAGFLFWIIRSAIRSGVKQRATKPGPQPQPAFPVATNQQGWYLVRGVDRQTRMDTTERIYAANSANAQAKAELAGVVVTSVEYDRRS